MYPFATLPDDGILPLVEAVEYPTIEVGGDAFIITPDLTTGGMVQFD